MGWRRTKPLQPTGKLGCSAASAFRRLSGGRYAAATVMSLIRLAIALALALNAGTCGPGSNGKPAAKAEIRVVAQHLAGNKLGIVAEDLRSLPNPRGEGTFVYCPTTRFSGVERKVIWLVLENEAIPLNGATKGSVTPLLPWPRDVPKEQWSATGLDPYSPSEALEIVFGTAQ